MALELQITAKGQVTLRQAVLEHLGVKPGDKIGVSLLPDGQVTLHAAAAGHDLRTMRAALHRPDRRPVTLREMQEAIERGDAP